MERLSRPSVEFARHPVELRLRVDAEVGALGKVLAQQAVTVFVRGPLPRTAGIAVVHLHARRALKKKLMRCRRPEG